MPSTDVPRGVSGVFRSRGGRTAHLKVRRMNSFVAFDFWTDRTRTVAAVSHNRDREGGFEMGTFKSDFLADKCQLHINKLLREQREPCEYVNYP